MTTSTNPPTTRQLAYLRQLARKTGTSFVNPQTRAQASREIARLKAIVTTGFTFAELQADETTRGQYGDQSLAYGPAIRDHEIDGYGSTATWSRRP